MKHNCVNCMLILAGSICIATSMGAQVPVPASQGAVTPVLVTDAQDLPVTADDHPLTGVQTIGVGSWGTKHSFLTPSLRLAESIDSNPLLLNSSSGGYRGLTDVGAHLEWMQYVGPDAQIQYSGAVRYDSLAKLQGYDQFANSHSVAMFKRIRFRTWGLLIEDDAQYSKGSSFGATGMAGMDSLSSQGSQFGSLTSLQTTPTSLRQDVTPDQSILTARVGRIANTALVELDKHLGARNTATLSASYAILHFDSSLLTDTAQESIIAGYNRTITSRDAVALESAYSHFHYQQSDTSLSTEYFSALYARRISGRGSIEFGGGPQITQLQVGQTNDQLLGWQVHGTAQYRTRRLVLSARAMRGISGGAGVLNGSLQTTVQGNADLVVSARWSASLTSGVARNQQLKPAERYDSQFAGISLNRRVGRYTNFFMSYDFQHQTTGSVCTGPSCAYGGLRNVFGVGLTWNYRPIGID